MPSDDLHLPLSDLKSERNRYYSLFMRAPLPVAILRGPDFIYELSNPANQKFLNNQPVIGKSARELAFLPNEVIKILEHVYTSKKTFIGRAIPAEFTINGKEQVCYTDTIFEPLLTPDGVVELIMVTGNDVTEAVLAQKRAEEKESHLRRLLDAIPQIVWTTDHTGETHYFNCKWWDYTGFDPKNYETSKGMDAVHPDDRSLVIEKTIRSYQEGIPFEAQYRLRSKEGFYRWHLGRLLPLRNSQGRITEWFGTATDIEQQKQTEIDLIEAQSRFRAFFEQSTLPMEIYALDGTPIELNQAWVKLFDTTLDQLQGYNILTDSQTVALGLTPLLYRAIGGEAVEVPPFFYEPSKIGKIGRARWLEGTFFPVKDYEGRVRELAVILRDVTDRENAEQSLRESNSKLELAVKARQDLLSTCGHELKTPLSSLRLQTQAAKRRISKGDLSVYQPERVEKLVDNYGKQIERLVHLVDDMLDFTRIGSGKLSLNLERVELSALVVDVLERFSEQLDNAGCRVSTSLDRDVSGNWDRFRIEQVFTNLLTNAMRYGKGKPITVTTGRDGGFSVLVVRDLGIGIAEENHERIFQRFERAVSASEISGLGLGLYIVKEIVLAHNGSIEVKSELGQGAEFKVKLP
jgi:PAS domain S-box-containing protein